MINRFPNPRRNRWPGAVILGFALAICVHAQQGTSAPEAKDKQPTQPGHKSDRVVAVIPAFNAEDNPHAPALSASQKFHLFTRTSKDPYNLIMPALNAVILRSTGSSSGYGSGFGGFAKRYGSSLADSVSGNFFRLYAFPALLHEDPRYFRARGRPVRQRIRHVFGATIVTRKDDETFRFNWSKLLASTSSSALSNAYYPDENRGARLTLSRIGLSYFGEFTSNALKEFWSDISRKK